LNPAFATRWEKSNLAGENKENHMSSWSGIGCRRDPFSSEVDIQSYYLRRNQEANFKQLVVRISSGQAPLLVTGEAGTGKTALLNRLNVELQASGGLIITIFSATAAHTLDTLLTICLYQIGLQQDGSEEVAQKMAMLEEFLGHLGTERVACLLVDEAQSMTDDVLMGLLELSAPGEQDRSPIPTVLAGHVSLEKRLADKMFAPLAGSIFRYRLPPMDQTEVASFIHHRLRSAGCPETFFSPAAIDRVFAYSGGIPATVKHLCGLAAFSPEGDERTEVTPQMVEAAASRMMLREKVTEPTYATSDREDVADETEDTEDRVPTLDPVAVARTDRGQGVFSRSAQGSVSHIAPLTRLDARQRPVNRSETEASKGEAITVASDRTETEIAEHSAQSWDGVGRQSTRGGYWALTAGLALAVVAATLTWVWHDQQPLGIQQFFSSVAGRYFQGANPKSPVAVPHLGLGSDAAKLASGEQPSAPTVTEAPNIVEVPQAPNGPAWPTGNSEMLTDVRVRERPTGRSRLVAILNKGDSAVLAGHLPGSRWYRLRTTKGLEGFVFASVVPRPSTDATAQSGTSQPTIGLLQLDEAEAESAAIQNWLALAEEHLEADRLMAPRFDNSLALFRRALRVEPENETALAGIDRIKEKLLAFARAAAAEGDLDTARWQISKVLVIEADDEAALAALAALEARTQE